MPRPDKLFGYRLGQLKEFALLLLFGLSRFTRLLLPCLSQGRFLPLPRAVARALLLRLLFQALPCRRFGGPALLLPLLFFATLRSFP